MAVARWEFFTTKAQGHEEAQRKQKDFFVNFVPLRLCGNWFSGFA